MSQLTTHVLDTSKGKPAEGITIFLFLQQPEDPVTVGWRQIAIGTTDTDGRIAGFLAEETILEPGVYRLKFETKEYFEKQALVTFYPFVEITFTITGNEHYHVPLLLNPFGYSTYRGS
ncbi:MAG: hydroxyisourate hydrolase [Bacteroidota bacterium]|nr:hydroxyisourate hydrolase [Chitinophagaceae bacterium]MDZ4808011.1 hydroxyisourate hydrolase [Bacteroidota bacterium]